jgi:hypothetical protein
VGDDMKILDTLGKSKKAIGGVIAIIVLVIAIFFAGVHYASGSNNDKITSTTIKNQLTEINELALYSYDYSKVGKFSNKLSFNGWKIPLTQKTFIITYDGSIKAGIDLKQAKISIDNEQLNITLPAAKILSHEIDEKSIEVYDESSNIFNQISINDYKSFATKEKKKNEKEAISNGILEKSKTKAEQTLTTYLQAIPEIKDYYKLNITIENTKTDE